MNDAQPVPATETTPAPAPIRQVVTSEQLTKKELGKLRACLLLRRELRDMVKEADAFGRRMAQKQLDVHAANDALADDIAIRLGFESFRALLEKGFEIGVDPKTGAATLTKLVQPEPVAP